MQVEVALFSVCHIFLKSQHSDGCCTDFMWEFRDICGFYRTVLCFYIKIMFSVARLFGLLPISCGVLRRVMGLWHGLKVHHRLEPPFLAVGLWGCIQCVLLCLFCGLRESTSVDHPETHPVPCPSPSGPVSMALTSLATL